MVRIKAEVSERGVGAAGKRTRRKWSAAEKVRMVQEAQQTDEAVSEIARRHGVHVSMVTRWRAQYRAGCTRDSTRAAGGWRSKRGSDAPFRAPLQGWKRMSKVKTTLSEKLAALPSVRRERIKKRAAELIAEEMSRRSLTESAEARYAGRPRKS